MDEEKKSSEQQISFKGGGDGRGDNGAKVFASIFNCCATTLRHFLPMPPCSCLPCGISDGEKKSSLDVTVVFLM